MNWQVSDDIRAAIEKVVRERFPGKVHQLEFEPSISYDGEDVLIIRVFMDKSTTADDFKGRFIGLTGLVRSAMGDEMRHIFPMIHPTEFHA